jgi:hypothetical protein
MASVFVRANAAALNDSQTAYAGTVLVGRGPIGDVAANTGAVVVTNYADDSLTIVRPTWWPSVLHRARRCPFLGGAHR